LVELREPAVIAANGLRQVDELVERGQDENLVTRQLGDAEREAEERACVEVARRVDALALLLGAANEPHAHGAAERSETRDARRCGSRHRGCIGAPSQVVLRPIGGLGRVGRPKALSPADTPLAAWIEVSSAERAEPPAPS